MDQFTPSNVPPEKQYLLNPAGPTPGSIAARSGLGPLGSEAALRPAVSFSEGERGQIEASERQPGSLAALDLEISRTTNPATLALLNQERARLATPVISQKPPSWQEVLEMPEMQGLDFDQREEARNQYFLEAVSPTVPTEQMTAARAAFDADTKPSALNRAVNAIGDVIRGAGIRVFGEIGKPVDVTKPALPLSHPNSFTPIPTRKPELAMTPVPLVPAVAVSSEGWRAAELARQGINRGLLTGTEGPATPVTLVPRAEQDFPGQGVRDMFAQAAQVRANENKVTNILGSGFMRGTEQILSGWKNAIPVVVNTVAEAIDRPHLAASGKPSGIGRMDVTGAPFIPGMESYPPPAVAQKKWDDLIGVDEHAVWLGSHVSEQMPQMVGFLSAASIPRVANAYLIAMGASSAGQQYQQTAGKGLDSQARLADAWVNGTVEALFEKLPLEVWIKLHKWVKGMPAEQAATALGKMLAAAGVTVRGVAAVGGQAAVEGSQEALTQIAQNLSQRYIAGDKSVNWNDNVKEAGIIGAAAGGIMGAPHVVAASSMRRPASQSAPEVGKPEVGVPEPLGEAPTTVAEMLGKTPAQTVKTPAAAPNIGKTPAEPEKPQERLATVNRLLSELSGSIQRAREPGAEESRRAQLPYLEQRGGELIAERARLEKEINPDVDIGRLQRQNRDRGRAASVAQMQSIANSPDYDRLATAPIPDVGSPMVSVVNNEATIAPGDYGKSATTTLADGTKMPVRYAVVEASDVIASHDVEGTENKAYFGKPKAGTVVALTNGRVAGLQAAYQRGKASGYLERLVADPEHGVSADAIRAKKQPMLVRVYDDTFNQLPRLAQLSNTGGSAQFSDVEKARNDAAALESLDGFAPSESGDVTAASNLPFARRFIQTVVPENERAEMLTARGELSQAGAKRIRAAAFTKAYGGGDILIRMVESTDDNVRSITAGLMRAAPAVAKLRDKVAAKALHDLDITPELVRAIEEFSRLRDEGTSVGAWLAQADIFGEGIPPEVVELLGFLEDNARSPRRIAEFMERYLQAAESLGTPLQGTIFERAAPRKAGVVRAIRKEMGNERETGLREGAQPPAAAAGRGAEADTRAGAEPVPGAGGARAEGGAAALKEDAGEGAAVDQAAHEAATSPENALPEPTKEQKEAGNYQKGHIKIGGLEISIENPAGSVRSGETRHGDKWQVTMKAHYGYVLDTEGTDGDHVDVFVKEGTLEDWNGTVFVVNQNNAAGKMDEHKAMIGYDSLEEARAAYLENYTKGWESRIRSIAELPLDQFKSWATDETDTGPKGGELVVDELRQELDDVLADLGAWVDKNVVPKAAMLPAEAQENLIPILSRLFTVAIKKGYRDFAAASKFVMGEIRKKAAELADLINESLLRRAYAQAGGKETADAETVRSDQGPVGGGRRAAEAGEDARGANLQREAEARPAAGDALPRGEYGEARDQVNQIPRAEHLSEDERTVETRFRDWVWGNLDEAVAEYRRRFGTIISTDDARELSPDYAASKESRSQFSRAVHEPARFLAKQVYERMLKEPAPKGKPDLVVFTAGGTGAGKTSSIRDVPWLKAIAQGAQMVYDTNMSSERSAAEKIDQALAAGNQVTVIYSYRDPVDALVNGALPRAIKRGRTITLAAHIETHGGSLETLPKLYRRYRGDLGVDFRFVDNSLGKGQIREITLEELAEKPHNINEESLYEALRAEREAGRISETVFRATLGDDRRGRPGVQRGARNLEESQGEPGAEGAVRQAGEGGGEEPQLQLGAGQSRGPVEAEHERPQPLERPERPEASDREGRAAREPAGAGDSRQMGLGFAEEGEGDGGGRDVAAAAEGAGGHGERGDLERPSGRRDERRAGQRDTAVAGYTGPALAVHTNYTITADDDLGGGGAKTKTKQNLAAIRLVKQLAKDERLATSEEQHVLVKYVGWGGLKSVFDEGNAEWAKERAELKELLAPKEFEAARRSVLDAHYTSETVVQGIYSALNRMGFTGGRVLEPAMGTGHFFGLMEPGVSSRSQLIGVELDPLTGMIARQLYQRADIKAPRGFQEVNVPAGYFDAVVGNPPFGSQTIPDETDSELPTLSIHNFFFAKSVKSLRPGGLLAMVVSHYFMDARTSEARAWIAKRAELVGAIRLPNTAFLKNANTEVTTDIVFLRRLTEEDAKARKAPAWLKVGEVTDEETKQPIPLNQYFIENPDMMLGRMTLGGTMYGAKLEATLEANKGEKLEEAIAEAVKKLPAAIYQPTERTVAEITEPTELVPNTVKVGGFFVLPDSRIARRAPDVMDKRQHEVYEIPNERAGARIRGMIRVRDALRKLMRAEMVGDDDVTLRYLRSELNRLYDGYVKKNGYINNIGNRRAFQDDPDLPLIEGLERDYDPGVSKDVAARKKMGITEEPGEGGTALSRNFQTDTPEFKRWFGDSKVVDDEGKPLVVYHGSETGGRFKVFKPTKTLLGNNAIFLTDDKGTAAGYGRVMPLYATIKKPLVVDAEGETWGEFGSLHPLIDEAVDGEHDGVIVKNIQDTSSEDGGGAESTVYVAFRPEQIKSATGNRGTFSPESADIRYSRGMAGAGGMALKDVNAVANIFRGRLKGLPPLHVLETVAKAPEALKRDIRALGGERDTAGAWHNGEVYLFAENLRNPEHAAWVILHEGTHHGLRGMWGRSLDPLLMNLYLRNKSLRQAAEEQRVRNRKLSVVQATEEALANMGADNIPQSVWAQIVAWVKRALRGMGVRLRLTDADVRDLVARALRYVKNPQDKTHLMSGTALHPSWQSEAELPRSAGDKVTVYRLGYKGETSPAGKWVGTAERVARHLGQYDDLLAQSGDTLYAYELPREQARFLMPNKVIPSLKGTEQKLPEKVDAMLVAAKPLAPLYEAGDITGGAIEAYLGAERGTTALSRTVGQPAMPKGRGTLNHPAVRSGYRTWAKKTIDTLDSWLEPIGKLPEKERYLVERYKTLGRIAKADELAGYIRKAFVGSTAEDKQAVYDYLTTAGATSTSSGPMAFIKDPTIRANAERVKKEIAAVGDALVEHGLLSEEAHEQYRDSYLPRLYLKHLLSEGDFQRLGAGKKPSDMGYLKERKDIPEDVRKVILGEITDPGFLGAVAVAKPLRDMVLLDWLSNIAQRKDWVLKGVLVEWGEINLLKPAATPDMFGGGVKKRLVSAYWLKDEATRIRRQAEFYDPATAKRAIELALKMERTANDALAGLKVDHKMFRQIPDTPRYGRLRGIWVRSEIYDDLMGVNDFLPLEPGFFQNLLGYGGVGTKITQLWKTGKVALNPPSQIRNFMSNGVLLQLSGVALPMVPVRVTQAAREIMNNGEHWKIAKKYGVTESTFTAQELYRAKRELLDLEQQMGTLSPLGQLHRIAARVMDFGGDTYQFMEALFKTAKIIDAMAEGMSEEKAALEAQKWLFDYSLVAKEVRYLRNAPIGVPFLTFQVKVLPRMAEVALLHPWRFLPWAALLYGMSYALAAGYDVDDDDLEKLKQALPDWLRERGHTMLLPFKDAQGRWQVLDLGYYFPWTNWTELARNIKAGEVGKAVQTAGLFSGPVTDLIVAIKTGRDPFTDRDIWKAGDPPARQAMALLNYLWTMGAPPFLTSMGFVGHATRAYTGETNRYGDPLSTPTQAALRLFGVNIYALEPEQSRAANIRKQQFEIGEVRTAAKQKLLDRSLSPERREAISEEYQTEARRRQEKLLKYIRESGIHPNLQAAP